MRRISLSLPVLVLVAGCSYDFESFEPLDGVDAGQAQDASSSGDSSVTVDSGVPLDATAPDTSAPDTAKPDTSAPDTSAPDTSVPDTSVPDTSVPDTAKPDTSAPDTSAPDTSAPDTSAPDAPAPDGSATDSAADGAAVACTEPGGKVYNGHCYFALTANVTGDAAKAACETRGAHLVTITSLGEQAFVAAIRPGNDRWIGLRSTMTSSMPSAFKWVTAEPVTYSNWGGGQPNNGGLCVAMRGDDSWNDRDCTETNETICERE
jgi:hypothetical protein